MNRVLQNERGIALAVAIFAIVVVGALVAGAFFAGTQEQRMGENVRRGLQSFGVAEYGVYDVIRTWDPDSVNSRPWYPDSGSIAAVPESTTAGGTGRFMGSIYKLNADLYLVDVTGADKVSLGAPAVGGARQRLGLLARVRPLQVPTDASLTTQGDVTVSGTAEVNGYDQNPTGWADCAPTDTNKAGIRTNGDVTVAGAANVDGEPPVVNDPTITDSTFTVFGEITYDDLVADANLTLAGGFTYKTQPVTDGLGRCDKSVLTNWGDGLNPGAACGSYFPIIYIAGAGVTTTLNTVQGQGILLVDGNLVVTGLYEFFGLVIIRGSLKTEGGGNSESHFWGMVMANNVSLGDESIAGKATLNYSKCALLKVFQNTQRIGLMRSRSWVQLF